MFLLFYAKSSHNCENYGFFGPKIVKITFFFADQNGELVYHDFKIIYKHFESASSIKLTMGEAKMCFMHLFFYAHKAI